jgi:membrane-bound ClpP family serine protease
LVTNRRGALYSGVALAAFGFIIEVVHAIEVFQPSGWLALAGFGVALVGLTAWLERRARAVKVSHPAAPGLPQ